MSFLGDVGDKHTSNTSVTASKYFLDVSARGADHVAWFGISTEEF